MTVLIDRLRYRWEEFFDRLDSEGVRMYQNFFYYILALAGAYCLVIAQGPPSSVSAAWGHGYFIAWCVMGMFSPIISILGSKMKGQQAYTGMILQLTGDLGTAITLGSFVLAVFLTFDWGQSTYATFSVFSAFLCTILFIVRDIRRMIQVEKVKKWVA